MNRWDRKIVRLTLGVSLAWSTVGCNKPTRPVDSDADLTRLPTSIDWANRAAEARKLALEFELNAGELQNAPLTRQRPQLRTAFTQLAELLPRLAGPARTGVFDHQYSVVVQVRDQLANRPERLSDEALVETGLLAAYNALRDLSYSQFYLDEELTKRLDTLALTVGNLPRLRGTDHAITVSDAVTTMGSVLTKMAGTLFDRASDAAVEPGVTTAPTLPPADGGKPNEPTPEGVAPPVNP